MPLFGMGNVVSEGFKIEDETVTIDKHEFKRFKLSDKEWFDELFNGLTYDKVMWEHCFAHLYSIKYMEKSDGDLIFYRIIKNHLCVFFYTHNNAKTILYFTPVRMDKKPIDYDEMASVLRECAEILYDINASKQVIFSGLDPEVYKETFVLKELYGHRSAYSDFVFLSDDIINLKGKKFQKRRNMYNTFKRNNPTATLRDYTDSDYDGVVSMRKLWEAQYESTHDKKDEVWDKEVVMNLVKDRKELDLIVKVVTIEDVVVALSIVTKLSFECFDFINKNYDPNYRGLSEYLWYETTKAVRGLGAYFNDGNGGSTKKDGLYLYKNSHNPILILDKKEVTFNKKNTPIDYDKTFKRGV